MKLFIGLVVGALIGWGAGLQVGKWAILDLQKTAVAGISQVEHACQEALGVQRDEGHPWRP